MPEIVSCTPAVLRPNHMIIECCFALGTEHVISIFYIAYIQQEVNYAVPISMLAGNLL